MIIYLCITRFQLSKLHKDGHVLHYDWLDKITSKEIQFVMQQEKRNSNFFYLTIDFPEIKSEDVKYHVLYFLANKITIFKFQFNLSS